MLKNRCIYLLILITTYIFFLFYKMWASWYCLMLVLVIPVISLVLCLSASASFNISTDIPSRIEKGDKASIKIKSKGLLSILSFCRFNMTVTDVMSDVSRKQISDLPCGDSSEIRIDTSHCGQYIYEFSDVRVYDIFGLFYKKKKAPSKCSILVKPPLVMPEAIPNLSGFRAKGLRKSNSPNSEIYDIREYEPGDPIKSVHWKISAKKDQLLIKEPQEEYFGHSRIVLRLTPDRDKMDKKLGEILFTSNYFLTQDISHKIRITPPTKREIAFDIESQRDLDTALLKILRMKLPKEEENAV